MIPARLHLNIAMLALGLVVTAAYCNHFHNEFHFDDSHAIQSNAAIKDLSLWRTYFTDPTTHSSLPTNQAFRPLLTLSFAIDYRLAGDTLDPFFFHLSTFIWFLLQGVLMYVLFLHLLQLTRPHRLNAWAALFMVGFFMLHTVNAETINYISARSDLLSTLPVVAAMLIFAKFHGWKRYLSLFPVLIGALVKPTAIMFLPMAVAYVVLFEQRIGLSEAFHPRHWLRILRPTALVGAVCIGLYILIHKMTPETFVPGGNSAFLYAITQPFVILRYFVLFFLPIGLSADSDWKLVESMTDSRFIIGMAFLLGMGYVIVRSSRTEMGRPVAFGLLWFLFALLPTSSFIPLSEVTNDHRMFFPFVGLTLTVWWPVSAWVQNRMDAATGSSRTTVFRSASLVAVLLLGAHAYGVTQRNKVWATGESLWLDVTRKSPENGRGHMNYGLSLMRQGNLELAMRSYRRALETDYRNHPYLYLNMAGAQNGLDNKEEAERLYRTALEKGTRYPDCHYYYASWLFQQGRREEAEEHVREALRLSPGHEYAKSLLQAIIGSGETLLQQAEKKATENPTAENFLNLSLQLYRNNDFEGCIRACEKALEIKPDYADAWNNICSAHNAMEQWQQGIEACEKALALRPDYQLARNNLNWAKSELIKQRQ